MPEIYSDVKQRIERLLLELRRTRGLPVTILLPNIVYRPYGTWWTRRLLQNCDLAEWTAHGRFWRTRMKWRARVGDCRSVTAGLGAGGVAAVPIDGIGWPRL